jgi:pimeloyl-ACP methyl ester carboxylesterase
MSESVHDDGAGCTGLPDRGDRTGRPRAGRPVKLAEPAALNGPPIPADTAVPADSAGLADTAMEDDRRPGRANRFAPRFRNVHGYRRAYIRAGRGPALLFIHGIGDSARTWDGLLQRFAHNHTVVAPDLLGHGLSDKPRADYSVGGYACGMRDLLGVLGIDRATVIGHSLGAGVAMQFAYQFPERCERLVLVAPGGVGRGIHPLLRAGTLPGADLVLAAMTHRFSRPLGYATLELLRLAGTGVGRDMDDVRHMFDALAGRAARRSFLRTLRTSVDFRGQSITMLDRCYLTEAMPTLLIGGARDTVVPPDHPLLAHAAMPGSRLEIFPRAGHFPHHADPDRFVAVVEDFLETTEAASHSTRQWRALLRSGPTAAPTTPSESGDLAKVVEVPITDEGHITSGGV